MRDETRQSERGSKKGFTDQLIKVKLIRLELTDEVTCGTLIVENKIICQTLELPWRNNKTNISCIPAGKYRCELKNSPTFGMCYEIMDVPDRSLVYFHAANRASELRGCVALGTYLGHLEGFRYLFQSRKAYKVFKKALNDAIAFDLEIISLVCSW